MRRREKASAVIEETSDPGRFDLELWLSRIPPRKRGEWETEEDYRHRRWARAYVAYLSAKRLHRDGAK